MFDGKFQGVDNCADLLTDTEYENCVFKHCNFSSVDLSNIKFIDCSFIDCDLSMVKLKDTALRHVQFIGSKLLGVAFDNCKQFGLAIELEGCNLSHSSFHDIILKKTKFSRCVLHGADFTAADLTDAVFDQCELSNAVFESCNLNGTDFRSSMGYEIDPDKNFIKHAHFSISGLAGLLKKYDIRIEE